MKKIKPPIVIIGIGELAGVFARAFLRSGHPVYPITRGMDMAAEAEKLPGPLLVLVAVAEKDFDAVMATIPVQWHNRLVLLQNELLPRDWEAHDIQKPTVISVWFEKKKGTDFKPLLPSPIQGPMADLIADCLERIGIPCKILFDEEDLVFNLALKNVFVFTINIAGLLLEQGATTSILWNGHRRLALSVASDVMDLQEFMVGRPISRDRLRDGLIAGIMGDPSHRCKGRSAPGRLKRALEIADEAKLGVLAIRDVNQRIQNQAK